MSSIIGKMPQTQIKTKFSLEGALKLVITSKILNEFDLKKKRN